MRKFFESIPDEPRATSSSAVGQITCAVINTSNEVKCPLIGNLLLFSENFRKGLCLKHYKI